MRSVKAKPISHSIVGRCAWGVAVAAVYIAVGKIGLHWAVIHPSATAIWPASGLALASVLLLGTYVWPAVFLGAFVVNLTTAGSVISCLGIALGNTLEAVLGALLVNRFASGRMAFDRPQTTFAFAAVGGGLSTMVSATIGVTSLAATGYLAWTNAPSVWITWWLGDATGIVIFAPVAILWISNWRLAWAGRKILEFTALIFSVLLVGNLVFGVWSLRLPDHNPLEFLCIPLILWAAFRFGRRVAATTTAVLSVLATSGTLEGHGPFAINSPNDSLLLLQAFVGVVSVLSIGVAATVWERKRAERLLRESEQRLTRYTTYLEQFVYAASHDLQEPLRQVGMFTELLAKRYHKDGPEVAQWVEFVTQGVRRMSELIKGLIPFASLVGTERHSLVAVKMNDAITTAQENLATVIDDAGAIVFADDLPTVMGEPAQLILLMQNLIANAIKYRSEESPRVHIEGMRGSKEWIFSVRDNGIGIEPEYHDLVFGLFKRLHNRTTPGAGMGLGIAKRIVELHGGRIWVDSALGQGSTFYFTIPTHRNHI